MPLLHLIAGSHGAGKTTFFERVLSPVTRLPLIHADALARQQALAQGLSFVDETDVSLPSNLALVQEAQAHGYLVHLQVVLVPIELSAARLKLRAARGRRSVSAWRLLAQAAWRADGTRVYDNSSARHPFRLVATYEHGRVLGPVELPAWSPWQEPRP